MQLRLLLNRASLRLPRGFREQENMAINFLGTWEQKENKTWNTGAKVYTKITEILLANPETQGNFCWEHGNMDLPPTPRPPGRPSSLNLRQFDLL